MSKTFPELQNLRIFFDSFEFEEGVNYSYKVGMQILNPRKYVESNLEYLESNSENKLFTPYYFQLIEFSNYLTGS